MKHSLSGIMAIENDSSMFHHPLSKSTNDVIR